MNETNAAILPRPKRGVIKLFDNIQFIYELNLARLEIEALGLHGTESSDYREVILRNPEPELLDYFRLHTAYYQSVNNMRSSYSQLVELNRTRSVNQYLTHWIYPYKGKFHPQMIRALINIIGMKPGEVLFEPFCGSGTAALEAILTGVNCVGIDISPLCVVQSRVKTRAYKVENTIAKLINTVTGVSSGGLFAKAGSFSDMVLTLTRDETVQEFFVLGRLLSLSDETRRGRAYESAFAKNVNNMYHSVADMKNVLPFIHKDIGEATIHLGDARSTGFPAESFDGVITSPPYSIALDYVSNDAHAIVDLGYEPKVVREAYIGVRGNGNSRIPIYNNDMMEVFKEIYRVLKPGKYAVIIIGNATYQGQQVDSTEFTIHGMRQTGFTLKHNINKIIYGLYNVMKQENILIFKKEH